jgi:RimJ/RimL family protein N-acetyltransferase
VASRNTGGTRGREAHLEPQSWSQVWRRALSSRQAYTAPCFSWSMCTFAPSLGSESGRSAIICGCARSSHTIGDVLTVHAPIVTDRLLLRSFRDDDLDALHEMRSSPEVVRFTYWPPTSREQTRAVIETRRQMNHLTHEGDALVLAIEVRQSGSFVGDVDLTWTSLARQEGEVGVMLHPAGQRKGYAQEAVAALLGLAFDDLQLHRIIGRTDARNTSAARCMRRLAMRQEAHFREYGMFEGEWYDELVFAMLAHEWKTLGRAS